LDGFDEGDEMGAFAPGKLGWRNFKAHRFVDGTVIVMRKNLEGVKLTKDTNL
jgi:hypothetical protein